jgi:muconolactone delta-isomerase
VNPASDSRDDLPAVAAAAGQAVSLPAIVYMAVTLPADTMPGGLAEVQVSLADAARAMTAAGHAVRYVNGMYLPTQTRLLCVFAAESEETVHATVELVRLPFVQISAITDRRDQDPASGERGPGH